MKIIIFNPYYKVTEVSMEIYQWLSLLVNSNWTLYAEQRIIYFLKKNSFFFSLILRNVILKPRRYYGTMG